MQERLLIQIVHNDPYLKSVLNSELAHIHDRMTQIVQSVEDVHDRALHTEQRVDSIETRVEQLERPGARKSGINCKCVLPKQLADEASRFHLGHQRQHCGHLLWRFAIQQQSTAPQSGHALLTQVGSMYS